MFQFHKVWFKLYSTFIHSIRKRSFNSIRYDLNEQYVRKGTKVFVFQFHKVWFKRQSV